MVREVDLKAGETLKVNVESNNTESYHWEYEGLVSNSWQKFHTGSEADGEFNSVQSALNAFAESGGSRGTNEEYRLMKGDEIVLTLKTGKNYTDKVRE